MKSGLLLEALIVGIIFAVLLLIASAVVVPDTIDKQIKCGFVVGVMGHLIFEAIGANKWYCTNGHACMPQ